jgi:hypothetical protein
MIAVLSALGLLGALGIVLGSGDLLRLRTMTSLAVCLATAAAALGPGPLFAVATAIAACRLHPGLKRRPVLPLALLMLTPAAAICLAIACVAGVRWPEMTALGSGGTGMHFSAAILLLALPAHRTIGFGWRVRLVALSAMSAVIGVYWSGDADDDRLRWIALVPVYAAALVFAVRRPDVVAFRRLAYAGGFCVCAPLAVLAAKAGPWTQAEGEELLIVRAPFSGAGTDGAYGVSTYSEAGIADGVTFAVSGFQESARAGTRVGGTAGLRARLWQEDGWIVSGEASAGLDPFSLRQGTGDWERHGQAEFKALAGWSGMIADIPVYAASGLGWRFRPQEFGDAALLSVSGGADLSPDVQLNAHFSADLNRQGSDSHFAQASLLWRLDESVALELGVQTYAGQDGDEGAQAFAGLWLRF